MLILLRKVAHSRHPLGYTIELHHSSRVKIIRNVGGRESIAYYTSKDVAIKEQANWYARACIMLDQAESADAARATLERLGVPAATIVATVVRRITNQGEVIA